MWSFNSKVAARSCATPLLLLLLSLSACSSSHRCASSELCNGRDDDCDGKADEDFLDELGRYDQVEHCGSCATSCAEVFPGSSETRCDSAKAAPVCELVACKPGSHAFESGSCIPDQPVLCLPCAVDTDCSTRTPGARCIGSGAELRCGAPCSSDNDCDRPFVCDKKQKQCTPDAALCACQNTDATFEVACVTAGSVAGLSCAGLSTCGPAGLSACKIASVESCDGQDDDCDGKVDEDFVDVEGRYLGALNCGGCGKSCSSPGPGYDATCVATATSANCQVACKPGFVDVDGIRANGCECQIFDGTTAPVIVGGDLNCDGKVDDDDVFVHVTTGGVDTAAGTLVQPLRSLDVAIAQAAAQQKTVLVAQGTYEPFTVRAGVSVFGGYRADFRARDAELFPVVIEAGRSVDGEPVMTCNGVRGAAVIDGVTLRGSDSTTVGGGSTTAVFDGCGPEVKLSNVVVLAGRAGDGRRGDDASARLPTGIASLAALNGSDAKAGRDGDTDGMACVAQPGGRGGQKLCGTSEVSGGTGGRSGCAELGCVNGSACANAGCTDFTSNGVCDYAAVLSRAVANAPASDGFGFAPGHAGALTYNAPTNRGVCSFCDDNPTLQRLGQDGTDGAPGIAAQAGSGCTDTTLAMDTSGRGSSGAGTAAPSGTDGSGGGGGTAGAGYIAIAGTERGCDDTAGGSGGGGGSGGCGAPGGGAGGGGGASIGLFVRVTSEGTGPVFDRVRIVTASGGRGGDGGIGAAGGRAGTGALGGLSHFFCARNGGRGGDGGDGGSGGGGGGGCGGASHAVFVDGAAADGYRGTAASTLTIERAGVSGTGGRGGFSPGRSGSMGASGRDDPVR
ncbi:MAG: Glycine-rich cell wall structural protein [Myxococcaceae bacterium]|nr:Glycine-rich cell wall structural protein [Myxococcaceae bacterium]